VFYRAYLLILSFLSLAVSGCGGGGSSGAGGNPDIPPTLEFFASPQAVINGQTSVLIWASSNASRCTASGGWSGSRAVSGSQGAAALANSATFTLVCTGKGGTVQQSATVDVFPDPNPPTYIGAAFGDSSATVSWQSQVGNSYAGFPVSSNGYVSTSPNIDVRTFSGSPPNQVMRGLTVRPVIFRGLSNGTAVYIVATDVANGVESAPSLEVSVTPRPVPPLVENIVSLNDSGVAGCTDLTMRNLPCPVPDLPNQDADHGRDAAARNGELVKTGFGPAGFDFTKLDANGDPLPDGAMTWRCVRDNVTGLIWEVPADSGLTFAENLYTWHQPDPLLNGGDPGQSDGGSCTGSRCDTDGFIQALNASSHCGFQDWRLPTRRELFSLVEFSRVDPGFVVDAFPNRPPNSDRFFWTSSTSSSTILVGLQAWAVYVATGQIDGKSKWLRDPGDRPGHILAVRADAIP
jgi:hypothetical protein